MAWLSEDFSIDVRMFVWKLKRELENIPDDYIVSFHEHARVDGDLRSDEIIIDHKNKRVILGSIQWFSENIKKYGKKGG